MMVSPPVNSAGILISKISLTHSALLKGYGEARKLIKLHRPDSRIFQRRICCRSRSSCGKAL